MNNIELSEEIKEKIEHIKSIKDLITVIEYNKPIELRKKFADKFNVVKSSKMLVKLGEAMPVKNDLPPLSSENTENKPVRENNTVYISEGISYNTKTKNISVGTLIVQSDIKYTPEYYVNGELKNISDIIIDNLTLEDIMLKQSKSSSSELWVKLNINNIKFMSLEI